MHRFVQLVEIHEMLIIAIFLHNNNLIKQPLDTFCLFQDICLREGFNTKKVLCAFSFRFINLTGLASMIRYLLLQMILYQASSAPCTPRGSP